MPDPRNWDWGTCLGVVAGHHWKRGGEPGSCAEGPRSEREDDGRKEKKMKERS